MIVSPRTISDWNMLPLDKDKNHVSPRTISDWNMLPLDKDKNHASPRTISDWNMLPHHIVISRSVETFKLLFPL
jgi:hypothetical protein